MCVCVCVCVCVYGFPAGSDGKESNAGYASWIPGLGRSPWRRKRQPTPVFLPGKSHGQTSLAGYSPRGSKKLDKTEHTQIMLKKKRSNFQGHL